MIVIIRIVFSILSMTLRHCLFNVWFPALEVYLKCSFEIADTKLVYLIRPWTQIWWNFDISIFEIWAIYVTTGWRFTLSVVRYQIFWASYFPDCVFKVIVVDKKARACMCISGWRDECLTILPVLLVVSSLFHHNVISSWINRRFTGLITSIMKEFSAFSISGEVILRDPSQITISDTTMHLM